MLIKWVSQKKIPLHINWCSPINSCACSTTAPLHLTITLLPPLILQDTFFFPSCWQSKDFLCYHPLPPVSLVLVLPNLKPCLQQAPLRPLLLRASHKCMKPVQVRDYFVCLTKVGEKALKASFPHLNLLPFQSDLQQIHEEQKTVKGL